MFDISYIIYIISNISYIYHVSYQMYWYIISHIELCVRKRPLNKTYSRFPKWWDSKWTKKRELKWMVHKILAPVRNHNESWRCVHILSQRFVLISILMSSFISSRVFPGTWCIHTYIRMYVGACAGWLVDFDVTCAWPHPLSPCALPCSSQSRPGLHSRPSILQSRRMDTHNQ